MYKKQVFHMEILLYFLTFLFIIIAAAGKAVMDTLRFHFDNSIFAKYKDNTWVNPALSWQNKWKHKSRFLDLLFSTVLVWTTDAWHFFQHIFLMFLFFSMIPLGFVFHWWLPILLYAVFTGSFQIMFWLFEKK
jgi:hypothetical protein